MTTRVALWNAGAQPRLHGDYPPEHQAVPVATRGGGRIMAAGWAPDYTQVIVADTQGVATYGTAPLARQAMVATSAQIGQIAADRHGNLFVASDQAVYHLHLDGRPPEPAVVGRLASVGITFAPDASRVALASPAGVEIYELPSGAQLATLPIVSVCTAGALAFSFDGCTLAAVTPAGIELWDVATGQRTGCFGEGVDQITSVAFEASNQTLIAVVAGRICRGKLESGLLIDVLMNGLDDVQQIATAVSGAVAVAGADELYLWPTSISGKPLCLSGPVGAVQSLIFDSAGHLLLAASEAELQLWDARDGLLRGSCHSHWGAVSDVAFASDGQHLAAVSGAGVLWRFDEAAEAPGIGLMRGRGLAAAVAFAPTGDVVVSASDTFLEARRVRDGHLCYAQNAGVVQSGGLGFAGGERLVVVATDGVQIRSAENGILLDTIAEYGAEAEDVALSPDGAYVAALMVSKVCLWNLQTGELCWSLTLPPGTCGVDISIGGGVIAVAAADSVRVWRIADAIPLLTLHEGFERVMLSSDGTTLAVARGAQASLYQVNGGTQLGVCTGHTDRITCLVFSPDNRRLATGSRDGTVRLWQNPTPTY